LLGVAVPPASGGVGGMAGGRGKWHGPQQERGASAAGRAGKSGQVTPRAGGRGEVV